MGAALGECKGVLGLDLEEQGRFIGRWEVIPGTGVTLSKGKEEGAGCSKGQCPQLEH